MKTKKIKVNASTSYDVLIGENLISKTGELISSVISMCKIAIITDDIVDKLYSNTVINSIESENFTVVKFVFKHGEQSKNIQTYAEILNFLAQNELTRTDAIIALGGGVVGDMAGFAAATYLRGIKYVQIPTTLLAQIDSSVGGKTAVDLPSGKNLVGAFKQPSLVICDVATLSTLDTETFVDGMGEVSKYALLDKKVNELLDKDYSLIELVYLCVDYKRRIVEADEFEGGLRKLLNLGHTPAHGIENLSGYTIAHGKAVAMGLDIILSSSLKHGYISQNDYIEMKNKVEKCVGTNVCPFKIEDICKVSLSDKKRSGDSITLIMVHGVEDCRPHKISVDSMTEYLR